jgi:cytochrome c oxidase subunit II
VNSTLPIQGTDIAHSWDTLYMFLVWLSVFFFVLVVGAMIWFAVAYRKHKGQKTRYITHHFWLEAVWIAVPTVLLLVIFGWGWAVYHRMVSVPSDAYEIRVVGKQWLWQFQYDNGLSTINELYVPANRPVKLIMSSQDVLHSLFVPAFRVKQDVVPGMYTSVWFEAKVLGKHHIFCTEYCGASHSGMIGNVIVLDEKDWERWYNGKALASTERGEPGAASVPHSGNETLRTTQAAEKRAPATPLQSLASQGQKVFEEKGCVACHATRAGMRSSGPPLHHLFGQKVAIRDQKPVIADENYLRESMDLPNAKIRQGYEGMMPTYKGQLTEIEANAVIAYVKSLAKGDSK